MVLFCHIHLKHISLIIFSNRPTVLLPGFLALPDTSFLFLWVYMFSAVVAHISLASGFCSAVFYLAFFLAAFFTLYFYIYPLYFTSQLLWSSPLLASGGAVFGCNPMYAGAPDRNFEVIDDTTGDVRDRYESLRKAKEMAKLEGQSERLIDWNGVKSLRST